MYKAKQMSYNTDLHEVMTSNVADWCVGRYAVWFRVTDSRTDEWRQDKIGTDCTSLVTGDNLWFDQRMIELGDDPR